MIRTVFRFAQKACEEKVYRGEVVFEGKIVGFSFKNNFAP